MTKENFTLTDAIDLLAYHGYQMLLQAAPLSWYAEVPDANLQEIARDVVHGALGTDAAVNPEVWEKRDAAVRRILERCDAPRSALCVTVGYDGSCLHWCACGHPSLPNVAHRSNECLTIGGQGYGV